VISASHEDYPSLLAEALDTLQTTGRQVSAAAEVLEVTTSQPIRLLKTYPAAWVAVNKHRETLGLPALK
jgi:hypothetical protein